MFEIFGCKRMHLIYGFIDENPDADRELLRWLGREKVDCVWTSEIVGLSLGLLLARRSSGGGGGSAPHLGGIPPFVAFAEQVSVFFGTSGCTHSGDMWPM